MEPSSTAALTDAVSGFTLAVLPESFLDGHPCGQFRLAVARSANGLTVRVLGAGLANQRALYADLRYPPGLAPVEAQAGAGLGATADVISLCLLDQPGVVHLGAVLKRWPERQGVSGAAELACVRFQPGSHKSVLQASQVPVTTASHSVLVVNCTRQTLKWDDRLPGDYNQDGLVSLPDLAQLGMHWDDVAVPHPDDVSRYVLDSIQDVIDSNDDQDIGLPDLTTIGINFGLHIAEWNLYRSADPAQDFPDVDLDDPAGDGGVPSKIAPFDNIAFNEAHENDPARERLRFSVPLPVLDDAMAYWVRPVTGGAEGTPSNYSRYDAALSSQITMHIDAESYLGVTQGTLEFEVGTLGEDTVGGTLWAEGVEVLRVISGYVRFDPALFDALGFPEGRGAIDETGAPLTITYMAEIPGELHLCNTDRYDTGTPGFVGTFRAVRVRFSRQPQTGEAIPAVNNGLGSYPPNYGLAFEPATSTLTWYYGGIGDTNQNGFAWMDDLIPVNYQLGMLGPFPLDSALYMVDGDSDGRISVHDIVPVALYYLGAVAGYNVYASMDPAVAPVDAPILGDPGIPAIGYVAMDSATGTLMVDRLHFSFQVPAPQSGMYLWVQPEYRGAIGGVPQGQYVQVP
jgi:hypothetical protein